MRAIARLRDKQSEIRRRSRRGHLEPMTNALLPPTPPRPAYLQLDSDTWDEIARLYLAGATAPQLARRYHVSVTTVHRHIKKRGHGKRGPGATAFARAHAAAALAEDDARRRHRISAEDLADLADREPHDVAVLAQVAATASGNAMVAQRYGEAKALADLALQYGRAAEQRPTSFRVMLLRSTFDRKWADVFFGDGAGGGKVEAHVKSEYWKRRSLERADEEQRARELSHLKARAARMEAKLRELGVEVI